MNNRLGLRGFTLIEIMVVITIVSLLAAVLFVNFNDARQDARNRALAASMKEVQLGIELYRAQKGNYPPAQNIGVSGCSGVGTGFTFADSVYCGTNPVADELVPEFMADFIAEAESANPDCHLVYMVDSTDGSWYKLLAENCYGGATSAAEGIQADDALARCSSTCPATGSCVSSAADFYQSYAIYSAGGQCK